MFKKLYRKSKDWLRQHHGFLTEEGNLFSWTRFHMLGIGFILPFLMLFEYTLLGTGYFLVLEVALVSTSILADNIENKWLKKHKTHIHYLILGNFIGLILIFGGYIYV